jgi:hypothetical protein
MKRYRIVLVVLVITAVSALFTSTAFGCSYADVSGCHTSGAPVTGG